MEALEIKWYSIVSIGLVGLALVGSVYVLWRKEIGANTCVNNENGCLWTSCWPNLHPAFLLVFRLFSIVVLAFFLSWDLYDWDASIFFYYTEWTHTLVMIYFVIGSVVSAHGCWLYYIHQDTYDGDLEENATLFIGNNRESLKFQNVGFWGYLMLITYQISGGAVVLTDVVFWCIIVPFVSNAHLGLNLLMGCMHTVNMGLLLLDTSINRLPFPWFRLAYFVIWSSLYVIFQWIIHLFGFTWWPYPFLKLSTPLAPLWYLILAAFHLVSYGLYALIFKLKDSLFSKFFPHSYLSPHSSLHF